MLHIWLVKADGSNVGEPSYTLDYDEWSPRLPLSRSDWRGTDASALLKSLRQDTPYGPLGDYEHVIVEIMEPEANASFPAGLYTPPVSPDQVMDLIQGTLSYPYSNCQLR
jgi:hypothetical protein